MPNNSVNLTVQDLMQTLQATAVLLAITLCILLEASYREWASQRRESEVEFQVHGIPLFGRFDGHLYLSLVSGKVLYENQQVLSLQKNRANFRRERFETKNGELGGGDRSGPRCHNRGCILAASCSRN